MTSFKIDKIWPMRIDLSNLECREILREKELICYRDIVSVLRAQGPPNDEKKSILFNLQKIFSISDERHKIELRRAANNEKLATISESISGFDGYAQWTALGALKFPPTQRPIPKTIFNDESCQTMIINLEKEKLLPSPMETNDLELTKKHEEAIRSNRLLKINQNSILTSNIATNTDPSKTIPKCSTPKDGSTSLEYNLHLLSEIATGESNQSINALDSSYTSDIKPDNFSIHHQIEDIELSLIVSETNLIPQSRNLSNNSILPSNVSSVIKNVSNLNKNISTVSNDSSIINIPIANSVPVVISNSNVNQAIGQRIVIPLNTISTHNVSHFVTNQQKHHASNLMPPKQLQTNPYYSNNNPIRSPPSNQTGYSWTSQASHAQQVYIQNSSTHHVLTGSQANIPHQNMDNLPPFGYVLQKRPPKIEQHQNNNKQTLVVRDLGSQPSMDPERNKRFMVVKGGNALGPTTKKPKISNPSNRQPGRPPLMPAPMPAYKPYVANDSCVINRTSVNTTSSIIDSPVTDSNGLKICSISSGNRAATVNSSPMMPNLYYTVNRGNGVQKLNSGGSGSGSVVQLGSGTHMRAMEHTSSSAGLSNTLKPKNIQPVISVVPLSPRGPITSDNSAFLNASIATTCVKEEHIVQNVSDKDSVMLVKIISKDEGRVIDSSSLSETHSENKLQ